MLTQGEDMEAQALASQGWSISAIARHLDRDRKTIRAYLRGDRQPGVRARTAPDPLAPFAAYLAARFAEDPHLWATALFDEVVPLGYELSYPSFARQLRLAGLRPHCEPCAGVPGRDTIEIEHPAGRGDPVGLGRAAEGAVGRHRLRAAGDAAALGPVARRAG